MNRAVLASLVFLFATASRVAASQPDSHPSARVAQATSGNPVCNVDLGSAEKLAGRGDVLSARKLRDYYWDCVSGDYSSGLQKWGAVSAKLGTTKDETEYLKILTEFRFENGGREWASPASCQRSDRTKYFSDGRTLSGLHRRIAYYTACENDGISSNILELAKRAAHIGRGDDVKFYADLINVSRNRSVTRK